MKKYIIKNKIQSIIQSIITFLVIKIILLIVLTSCNEGVSNLNNTNVVFPDSGQVNYYTSVQPFLNFRCAYSGCHSDFHIAGGRSMSSYFRLFESANLGLVIPKNSTSSVLFQIVNGQNNHLYVYNLPLPTENQINGIKRWIDQGAREF